MRRLRTALFLLALGCLPITASASVAFVSSVTAPSYVGQGVGGYGSAIIDTANSFVAFGSSSTVFFTPFTYSNISTIATSPLFTYSDTTLGFRNLLNFTAAIFDPGTGYSYWATNGSPAAIERIHLTAPVSFSSASLPSGQIPGHNQVGTAVIDTINGYGYFGTRTGVIIKIRLSDFPDLVQISSLTLPAGHDSLSASFIDAQSEYAYFASSTTIGRVAKIRLSDFKVDKIEAFNDGEGGVGCAVMDADGTYGYFGTHNSPGKVVRVHLPSLSRVAVKPLRNHEDDLTSAVIDPVRGFAYFGTNTSPAMVIPLYLPNLVEGTAVPLGTGMDFLRSAVIDTTAKFAYFGTYTTPGIVVKLNIFTGAPDILLQPSDVIAHAGEAITVSVIADGPAIAYQWQLSGVNIAGATSPDYTRVLATADDQSTLRCVLTNPNGTATTVDALITIIPDVRAYPNPWRSDIHTGVAITFDGILPRSTVKIFTLSARWVKTLPAGTNTWDVTNDAGERVASGYYFYLVTTGNDNQTSRGKIAIIR